MRSFDDERTANPTPLPRYAPPRASRSPSCRSSATSWRRAAWSLSAFTHLLVVVGLGLCTLASPDARQVVLDVFSTPSTMNEEAIQHVARTRLARVGRRGQRQPGRFRRGRRHGGRDGGFGGGAGASPMVELASSVGYFSDVSDMGGPKIGDIGGAMTPGEVRRRLGSSIKGQPARVVDNYDEAFDAITNEIVDMLEDKKVLLVWAFDQSESMQDDIQEDSRTHQARLRRSVGLRGQRSGRVALVGRQLRLRLPRADHDKPTSDVSRDQKRGDEQGAGRSDGQGIHVCGTVGQTIDRYKQQLDAAAGDGARDPMRAAS